MFSGLALKPGQQLSYGIVPAAGTTGLGPARHHVFHLTSSPIAALTTATLLFGPLIARLHGAPAASVARPRAILAGPHRATDGRTWAVPVTLADDDQGRRVATLVDLDGQDDLVGFARAEALALLPPGAAPGKGARSSRLPRSDPARGMLESLRLTGRVSSVSCALPETYNGPESRRRRHDDQDRATV